MHIHRQSRAADYYDQAASLTHAYNAIERIRASSDDESVIQVLGFAQGYLNQEIENLYKLADHYRENPTAS